MSLPPPIMYERSTISDGRSLGGTLTPSKRDWTNAGSSSSRSRRTVPICAINCEQEEGIFSLGHSPDTLPSTFAIYERYSDRSFSASESASFRSYLSGAQSGGAKERSSRRRSSAVGVSSSASSQRKRADLISSFADCRSSYAPSGLSQLNTPCSSSSAHDPTLSTATNASLGR